MSTNIVNLKTGRTTAPPSATGSYGAPTGPISLEGGETVGERVQDQLDDLNAVYAEPSANLSRAMTLISSAMTACTDAIEAEQIGDRFRSDDCMLRVQSLLPELFRVRQIGDGFGVISAALMYAFVNKRGVPFTKLQMHAVLRALKAIWSMPFLSIDAAVEVTNVIEAAELVVDPVPLTDLFTAAEEAGFVDV